MSKDIAIEANELTKTYPPDVRALDGLSLAVPAGTIFGLLGPNGAGKSTTVRILTTLSRPDGGSARVAGLDVLAEPVRVRHAIGVVAQRHGLDPDTISGGPGNDRINVVRGDIDSVRCGAGRDVVFADPGDRVAGDCEDVRR